MIYRACSCNAWAEDISPETKRVLVILASIRRPRGERTGLGRRKQLGGILLLFLFMFLLLGPRKTSELARQVGQHLGRFKRAVRDLRSQLENTLPTSTFDARLPGPDPSSVYLSPSTPTLPGRRVEEICKSFLSVESPPNSAVQVSVTGRRRNAE